MPVKFFIGLAISSEMMLLHRLTNVVARDEIFQGRVIGLGLREREREKRGEMGGRVRNKDITRALVRAGRVGRDRFIMKFMLYVIKNQSSRNKRRPIGKQFINKSID